MSSRSAWFVVQTKPEQEHIALAQLTRQGYVCFLPTLARAADRMHGGEPLFARYLFVKLDAVAQHLKALTSTQGVSGLLAIGATKATLPEAVIESLMQASAAGAPKPGKDNAPGYAGLAESIAMLFSQTDKDVRTLSLIDMIRQPGRLLAAPGMLRRAA